MKKAFASIKSAFVFSCAVLVGLQAASLLWPLGITESPITSLPVGTILQAIGAGVFGMAAFYAVFFMLKRDWPFSKSAAK